jgi:hypothetical protein
MDRYLAGLLDPFVSLLEVHKLLYFMQEAGEPLRLRIAKGPYGPYAENLRHVLSEIEGYYVSGYGAGDRPRSPRPRAEPPRRTGGRGASRKPPPGSRRCAVEDSSLRSAELPPSTGW